MPTLYDRTPELQVYIPQLLAVSEDAENGECHSRRSRQPDRSGKEYPIRRIQRRL